MKTKLFTIVFCLLTFGPTSEAGQSIQKEEVKTALQNPYERGMLSWLFLINL